MVNPRQQIQQQIQEKIRLKKEFEELKKKVVAEKNIQRKRELDKIAKAKKRELLIVRDKISRLKGKPTGKQLQKAAAERREIKRKELVKKGEVTKIDFAKKTAIIDEKRVTLTSREAKSIQLSAVKRAEAKKPIKTTIDKKEVKIDPKLIRQKAFFKVKETKIQQKLIKQKSLFNKIQKTNKITTIERQKVKSFFDNTREDVRKEFFKQLKEAPKNIGKGLYEVGKEVVVLSKDAIVGSYNYGKGLVKRIEAGEKTPLDNDIKKLAQGTVNVGKFIKNNPREALAITGAAGTSLGKDFKEAFINNPVKTTTKSVAYLFPGTIVKGTVKTAGLGTKGVTSTIQAKRLIKLEKTVKPLRTAIPLKQNNKLDKLVGSLSKVSNKNVQNNKINTFLNSVAKEQNIKLPKGKNIQKKIDVIKKQSKIIPIGDIKVKVPITKKQPKKPIKVFDFNTGKVKRVSKEPKFTPKIARDKTKYIKIEAGKLTKVTKGQFKKLEPKIITKKQPKKPIKFIDLKGDKVTKISDKSPKLTRGDIFGGKKGQARIFRGNQQIQIQINKEVTKVSKKLTKLKKKPNKLAIAKTKKELNILKRLATTANLNRIFRAAAIIQIIDKLIGKANAIDKLPTKVPAKKMPSKIVTPIKDVTPGKVPKKKTPTKIKKPLKDVTPKKTPARPTPTKTITKVPKKPVKKVPPKKPIKPIKFPILRINIKTLPKKGSRQGYIVNIKEGNRIVKRTNQLLPKNRATNFMRRYLDNNPQASGVIIPKGKTSVVDINKTILGNKFRVKRSKGTKVLKNVEKREFRLDKSKEKAITKLKKKKKKTKKIKKKKKHSKKP